MEEEITYETLFRVAFAAIADERRDDIIAEADDVDWKISDWEFTTGLFDSIDLVEMVMAVEEHYDINIPDAQLSVIGTADDLFTLVKKKVPIDA